MLSHGLEHLGQNLGALGRQVPGFTRVFTQMVEKWSLMLGPLGSYSKIPLGDQVNLVRPLAKCKQLTGAIVGYDLAFSPARPA